MFRLLWLIFRHKFQDLLYILFYSFYVLQFFLSNYCNRDPFLHYKTRVNVYLFYESYFVRLVRNSKHPAWFRYNFFFLAFPSDRLIKLGTHPYTIRHGCCRHRLLLYRLTVFDRNAAWVLPTTQITHYRSTIPTPDGTPPVRLIYFSCCRIASHTH